MSAAAQEAANRRWFKQWQAGCWWW